MVREQLTIDGSIYALDRDLIQSLQPDVILAQDLCRVCAVPSGEVEEALDVIGCRAEVLSLDPHSLDDVLRDIRQVGRTLGVDERAQELVASLRDRIEKVRRGVRHTSRRRVVALEWADPPFNGGHWIPEMIGIAGGDDVIGEPGARSRTLDWQEIVTAAPDVILFMPCGYELTGALDQVGPLLEAEPMAAPPLLRAAVYVTDSSAYFSRSGPRLVDGVEILAGILHPDLLPPPDPRRAVRVALTEGRLESFPLA